MNATQIFGELNDLDVAAQPDDVLGLLNAASLELVRLLQQPAREPLDHFLEASRASLHQVTLQVPEATGQEPLFTLGELAMLVEMAQAARHLKLPDQALKQLGDSHLKYSIVEVLVAAGRMRVSELAEQLDKFPQNLVTPCRDLVEAGLIEREEIGRSAFLSATPLGRAALKHLDETRRTPGVRPRVPEAFTRAAKPQSSRVEAAPEVVPFVLQQCGLVEQKPPDERIAAAVKAAEAFEVRFSGSTEPAEKTGRPANEASLALAQDFAGSESVLLKQDDLKILGTEPGIYMPGVLRPLGNSIALDCLKYTGAIQRLVDARTPPGVTAAQLLGTMADQRKKLGAPQLIPQELVPRELLAAAAH
jgi:DNA-binding MarR family transcriptional regulator